MEVPDLLDLVIGRETDMLGPESLTDGYAFQLFAL